MSLSEPLDPKRPWITDLDDVPGERKTAKTLFWPLGRSSQVTFTRAWMVCFMSRILIIVVPAFLAMVAGFAGASAAPIQAIQAILLPIIFIGTVFLSLNSHIRRLADAGRSVFLAALAALPLMLAAGTFVFIASKTVPEANKIQERIDFARENPELAEKQAEEAKKAREAARSRQGGNAQRARGGRRGGGRGPGGSGGPGAGNFNATGMVMGAAAMPAVGIWALSSFLIMLWSLMWVARLPRAKRVDLSGQADPPGRY